MVLLLKLSFLEYPILDKLQQPLPRQSYFTLGHPDYDVCGISVAITGDKNNEDCQPHRCH
jgi:hypothetical protein